MNKMIDELKAKRERDMAYLRGLAEKWAAGTITQAEKNEYLNSPMGQAMYKKYATVSGRVLLSDEEKKARKAEAQKRSREKLKLQREIFNIAMGRK